MPELRFFDTTIKNAHVVFRSTNVSAQFNAILDGIGLGLVHCFMAQREASLQVVLPEHISVESDLLAIGARRFAPCSARRCRVQVFDPDTGR